LRKIIIDEDLAAMYNVETERLNEQVKRNIKRFPKDFMSTLTEKEYESLKSQNATSSRAGKRYYVSESAYGHFLGAFYWVTAPRQNFFTTVF
jgi:hypothetical protein